MIKPHEIRSGNWIRGGREVGGVCVRRRMFPDCKQSCGFSTSSEAKKAKSTESKPMRGGAESEV